MPDRKKLLQDFYAKYAPDQELSDERLKAINTKYGEDNDRLLQDFYTKYAPNEQVTPERLDAIYGKYGLKKKEPTQQAGALGAMPSRSASSGNLQEMLAAAPPLPAGARVNVPIGAQPQRPQERAITTALPPIGNIPLRTEEQRTEERRALYEPSQVSKRLSNFAVEMTTVLPAIEQWQTQAGNAMLGRFAGKEANEAERAMMIAQEVNLQDLESKLQEGTEGEIIQSFNKRDIPALAYGIFDASMGILRSGIVGGLTMGAGVIPDMMAQSTRSFNKSKAEALGITPEQLIEQGKEDVAIPTIIGAIGGSLELVGLKGITSAITKKIGTKVGQQIATGLMGTGGEGITEWTQAGLERANESLAKGKSVADATNDAVELMFSEDGLEAALKGMTGAGTTIAAGRGIRALTSAKAKIDAGQPITAQEAQDIAVANIESNGAVAAALENMVNLGAINQQQAQVIGAEMEAMSNAAGKVPDAMAASAPQLAPIILEKQNIDARIAELNVEMATKDESFAPLYKMEIRDLEARKTQLNEQIQAVITPQAQQQVTEAGEVASPVAEQAGAVVEGVQEGGVDTRIANSPLAGVVNKRGVITDANGNLVEGDVYVDGERVVLEAGGKIYDTLGSIDELSQMTAEQLPVQVVAPRITATEGGFTYNSDAGVMPQGTRITPQGKGLKAVKRDKNGNVKSVVVKDDAGNTFNLKGEDAQAMAFELMMDEISKGNLDAKIVLNDEAATAINTAGRPATTQAADSGATQADATRQGAATPTTATERGDGGRGGRRGDGGRGGEGRGRRDGGGRGSRVEATQETEAKPKTKPDAAKKPSTEGVDARKQAEDGEGVGKEDSKRKEAAQEGEVADKPKTSKERLAEVRERKKAAMDVLKKQWNDAKNTGISTDFEQRLKDDKAFFGAIRDIIQSNIEIGALKITDSLNDIADALGIKLSKADKDAVKGVFNKEVLRSLKSEQADRFETEAVREALGEYIEENKQVLKGAANAQALKLVNEASTEGGFNRALKYIDKLIDSAEFREAVSNATDAVKNAPSKLSGFAQVGGLVKAIANIKVRGIEDVALLKKMAEILTKPTKSAPFELQNLVNEVNDYLTKKADPEGLSTQEDVLKEFKRITTERVKNEEGEIETRPKTLDTARKIKNYAQRIAEIESAMIDVVQDEAVMEDLRAKIEAEKTRINEAAVKLKEEMEQDRKANILFTKSIINVAKAGDMFSDTMYKAAIKPIQQTKGWEKIVDSADYYTSVKYRNAFDAVAAGYLPRYLFRDITIPLTNFGKVEGAIALSEAAKPKIKKAAKEVDTQPKAFNSFSEFVSDAFGLGKPKDKGLLGKGKQLTKKDIVEKMQSKYAQYIDAMYGMENEAVFLDNFLAPTQNAFEAKDNAVQSVMNKFYKDAGISQTSMVFDTAKNTKLESFYKVFYHLLQNEATANGKSGNILKEQLDLIKESSVKSSIPDFKLKIIERISNKYPNGVSDKNLTIGEKKMVKAFKDALNTLKPLQEQANIRRGLDFNAVSEYVPHMALDYSFTPRDIRGETLDFEQAESMLSDAGNVQYKNPKIKSDRGISRVENPSPFVYNPDITTILGVSANQVLTDYYLFPQIYGANRAFTEATKATGSAMPDALRTRYGQMIRMQGVGFKGKAFRAVGGVLKAAYANVLARPIRISQEMIGGIFNYKATGKHGKITRLPKDLKDAVMLSKDGSYKAILDLARKDAYTDVVEFEDGLLEKAKSIGKKAFDVGTSPDAINDGTYRRAHMVSAMRDKFKEITGEDINFNKAASDSEYQAQYKDALKEASTYAYNQTYVKYYSKGRLSRPARPLSFKGHYLYDTTSQGDVAVLADRMLFVFGQYAHRMSQLFHQRMRDGVTDNNYGRTVALSSIGGFLMTAVSYQLVKEFRNYAFGDDEEKKKAEFRFKTTMTSPDYYVAQLFSAFSFFAMGQYGSIGRGMAYLAAYQYSRALKDYKGTFSKESVAEFESTERALNNAIKDLTFYQLPSTDYGFKSSWLEVMLGGGSFLAEETSKIINEVSNLALDAANGDVDAQKAMYVAGFLYNATLSQRTGITIPMLKDLRDREKNLTDQQMTPEALKKKLNKDSKYASQIFEDVALKAALEVVNNEKSNEEAFNDAYELIGQALPDMDEEDRDSKLTKQFTKMLMPTYLHTIDKEQNPEVRGLMFREKRDEVLKSLNEAVRVGNDANIDKYEKMQQELEMYYLENLDNERFIEGFSIPDAEGN